MRRITVFFFFFTRMVQRAEKNQKAAFEVISVFKLPMMGDIQRLIGLYNFQKEGAKASCTRTEARLNSRQMK